MAMIKRLRLDPIRCTGEGLCAALYPEGIHLDDWGYPIVAWGPIASRDLAHAKRAVAACPVLALTIVREPAPKGTASSR